MAKAIADSTGGVTISIDNVRYATMIDDTTGKDTEPKYGKITPLPNAKSIKVESNDSTHTENYDGMPKVIAVSKGEKKATFVKSDFSDEERSALLGNEIIDGVLVEGGEDTPPYIALGFRLETTKGHRYYWLLKGMMTTPSVDAATKEQGSLTFQNQTMEGSFISRAYDSATQITAHVAGEEDTDEFMEEWFSDETLVKFYKKESQYPSLG